MFKPKEFKLSRHWFRPKAPVPFRMVRGRISDIERDMAEYFDAYPGHLPKGSYCQKIVTLNGVYVLPKPRLSLQGDYLHIDFGTYTTLRETHISEVWTFDHKGRCLFRDTIDVTYKAGHRCNFYYEIVDSGPIVYTTDQMVDRILASVGG